MQIALAAAGFYDRNIEYNKNKIISILQQMREKADLIVFGETFLQGFECLDWKYETDSRMAVEMTDPIITEIRAAAENNRIAVSFGFVEKENNTLYSSQLTVGGNGDILNLFRRVSKGWKEPFADEHYAEGTEFTKFSCHGKTVAVGLCGDLWDDTNASKVKAVDAELVLWPVYTDFDAKKWNERIKYEYARQSLKAGSKVLLVNSVCLNSDEEELASGGAVFFENGKIIQEAPAGDENILIVEV